MAKTLITEDEIINACDEVKKRALEILRTRKATKMALSVVFDIECPTELKTEVKEWLI